MPLSFPGDGRRPGPVRAGVRLVVVGRVHVRDVVRRDAVLRRVARRDLRKNHEPQGE